MLFETLESRRFFSAVAETKEIHEVAGTSFTADLGAAVQLVDTAQSIATATRPASAVLALHALIHWGDGKTSVGTVVTKSDGTSEIEGSHAYTTTGRYHIVVYVDKYYTGSSPHPIYIIPYQTLHDVAEVSAAT